MKKTDETKRLLFLFQAICVGSNWKVTNVCFEFIADSELVFKEQYAVKFTSKIKDYDFWVIDETPAKVLKRAKARIAEKSMEL